MACICSEIETLGAATTRAVHASFGPVSPTGTVVFGNSTPGCAGPLTIGAATTPSLGNACFAVTCRATPPGSPGFLALSGAPLVQPFVLFGMELWIDPGYPVFVALGTVSESTGLASVPLPLPPDPGLTGAQLYAQFLWPDSCAPGSLAASQALAVTIQP